MLLKGGVLLFTLNIFINLDAKASDSIIDNQQKLTQQIKVISNKTNAPTIQINENQFSNIEFSEESDDKLNIEVCFKSKPTPLGPKKGDSIVVRGKTFGVALDDLNTYETVDGLYFIYGTVPKVSVSLETLPEQRVLPLIINNENKDKFDFLEKDFSFKKEALEKELNDWIFLVKPIATDVGLRFRAFFFFKKKQLIAFSAKLSPKLKAEINKAGWTEQSPLHGVPVFVRQKIEVQTGLQLNRIIKKATSWE